MKPAYHLGPSAAFAPTKSGNEIQSPFYEQAYEPGLRSARPSGTFLAQDYMNSTLLYATLCAGFE